MLKGIYFFVIGAFVGWMLECVFKFVTKKFERTPGILNTPFCILYGIGTVVLSLILTKITNNFMLLFFLSFLTLTILEYVTYMLLEEIYGLKLWDYSHNKLNIGGKVCISFSIIWGILGTGYIKYLFPLLNKFYDLAKGKVLMFSIILSIIIIVTDFTFSSYKLLKIKREMMYEK